MTDTQAPDVVADMVDEPAAFIPETVVDEIAPDIFRISTFIPHVSPDGFTFNQFLVRDDEPFLFHTGMNQLFPLVSAAVASIIPLESLRWISFAHVEADECGSMNEFLAAAPDAQVVHGPLACEVSLNDLAARPPRAIEDGGVLVTGSIACGSSRRRTSRTTGRAVCGSTRRRRPCSPGTCSPRSATAGHRRPTTW